MTSKLQTIPIGELHESPWNPRKHFDPASLAELAKSLTTSGQLTPVIARPLADGGFELAAGHRRYRAAKLAGLMALEVKVMDLDDNAFLEILTIENLQREDVHPLDEAEGYAALMKATLQDGTKYDVATIAARVRKSDQYIYDRLHLLQLVPAAKKLFLANRFSVAHAVILARLSPTDQARVLNPEFNRYGNKQSGLWQPEDGGALAAGELDLYERRDADPYAGLKPVTVRELQIWVNDNVRFDPKKDPHAPMLFPETVAAVEQAEATKTKIVHITYEYRVPDGAKDPKIRTYGAGKWKRADGEPDADGKATKPCDHAVVGLVVAGPDRGQAFEVCVASDRCETHWPKEVKAKRAAAKLKDKAASGDAGAQAKLQKQRAAEEVRAAKEREKAAKEEAFHERARAAAPKLLAALAKHVRTMPITKVIELLVDKTSAAYPVTARSSVADVVRSLAMADVDGNIPDPRWSYSRLNDYDVKHLKAIGFDVLKVLDEVAPDPAAAKSPAKKAVPKKKGKK